MKLTTAAVQMSSDVLGLSANLQRADDQLRRARDAGVELTVLPELFNTGYSAWPDFGPHGESPEGPTLSYLRGRARRWRMHIAAGYVEREGRHLYNSLAFCTRTATCTSIASGTSSSGSGSASTPATGRWSWRRPGAASASPSART